MAADRSRLAAALAYRQAEEERRRRMMESVPGLVTTPAQPAPRADFRTNLENLSIGLGEGLTNQLEGVKGIVTDPVGTAKGVYEAGRAVIRDPSVIADALRYTAQKATSGPLGAGEVIGEMLGPRKGGPMMQELDVYHGTPHRFPATEANPLGEFDASKIGTGEGAQAYGHGVYLAESPNIAKHYQTQLGKFYDQMQTPEGAMSLEEAVTKYHPDGKAAAKVLSTFRTKTDVDTFNKVINDEILPEIRAKYPQSEWGKFAPQQGTLYKADLPDEMIDRMLDWDKPLSQQSDYVKKVFGYTEPELPKDLKAVETGQKNPAWKYQVEGFPAAPTEEKAISNALDTIRSSQRFLGERGEKLYQQIAEKFVSAKNPLAYREASEELLKRGIPGIKYLDAGSRGQGGSGTRNFVVFPGEEKKVRILERDGQKAPPQKIAQALEATSKSQNLVDVFNKTAKREIELANKRIVDPDEPYLTQQPISNLKELDQLTDPIFNYAKANVLKHIGEKNGFKVKIEGSNVSPSVYAKFTKVDDEGVTDFKVRISDHADVSRNKPAGEKKAYDINPDSNGSMEEIIQLLNDQNWLKQFYELD